MLVVDYTVYKDEEEDDLFSLFAFSLVKRCLLSVFGFCCPCLVPFAGVRKNSDE